ncbi:hypothetical protein SEUCBS140593_006250 [Sporothrix eucalyptigena]|uniref:Uncharacterized protein n=1 Tax=Sporothrix eucalyptigena TaxID=1812306 RepID=A0ABP0C5B4_9PEZI
MGAAHISELPLWSPQEAPKQPYGQVIRGMLSSGLAYCGFAIFYCVYDDDHNNTNGATWARFLDAMKQRAHVYVRHHENARQAFAQYGEPALKWAVIEDKHR